MAVRTIGVSVTGKGELEKVAKLVSSIKSNLASLEKELAGLEGPAVSIRVGLASKGIIGETTTLAKMLSNHKDTGVKLNVSLKSKGLIKEVRNLKTRLQEELDGVSVKLEAKNSNTSNNSGNSSTQSLSNKKSTTRKSSGSGGGNRLTAEEIKERNDLALQKKAQEAQIQVNKAREIAQIKAEADAQKRIAKAQEDNRRLRAKQQQERERAERQAQRDAERQAKRDADTQRRSAELERKQQEIYNLPNTYRRTISERVGKDKKAAIETYFSYMDGVSKAVQAKYLEGSITTHEAILNNNPKIVAQLLAKRYNDSLNLGHSKHRTVEGKGLLMDENDRYAGVPIAFDGTILHGTRALAKELAKLDEALESIGAPEEVRRASKEVLEIIGMTTDEVEELNDRFLESMKALETLGQLADSLNQKLLAFARTSLDKGFVLPLRTLTGIYTQSSRQMISMSLSAGRSMGQNIYQGFRSGFYSILSYARQTLGAMVQDARELSDAMTNYRNNMSVLGLGNNEINRNIKDLGDYGRRSVYDASDLLNMSSNYIALGFSSEIASQMTKAMAGLVANRDDSHLGIARATKQLEQILVKGKASTEDLNTMRQWFNAIGVKRFNDGLKAIADEAGYGENIAKATKEGALTAEKIQELIIKVGTTKDIQALVTKIATPGQAVANLRETLANLLAYDKITENPDGTFTRADAPLSRLYRSTTQFIKGVSEIIGSDKFTSYATNTGNMLSRVLDFAINTSKTVDMLLGSSAIRNVEKFFRELIGTIDSSSSGIHNGLVKLVKDFTNALGRDSVGSGIGRDLSIIVTDLMSILSTLARNSPQITRVYLSYAKELSDFVDTVLKIGERAGAFDVIAQVITAPLATINDIIKYSGNQYGIERVVNAISLFSKTLFGSDGLISYLANKGGLVRAATTVVDSLVKTLRIATTNFRNNINSSQVKAFFDNLAGALNYMLQELGKLYGIMLTSLFRAGSGDAAKRFFNAVARFVIAVNQAIVDAFKALGNGSVERGLEVVLNFMTELLNLANSVVRILGKFPKTTMAMLLIGKAIGFITSVGQGLLSLGEALKLFGFSGALSGGGGSTGGLMASIGKGYFSGTGPLAGVGIKSALKQTGANIVAKSAGLGTALKQGLKNSPSLIKGIPSMLKNSFGSVKGDLITAGVSIGSNLINGMVQSSGASKNTKKISNFINDIVSVATSTISGASLGAAIGSPTGVGAIVGGAVGGIAGFGTSVFSLITGRKQAEQEERARKEIEKAQKEQAKAEEEYRKQSYLQTIDTAREQLDSVRGLLAENTLGEKTTGVDKSKLEGSLELIRALSATIGEEGAYTSLGLKNILPTKALGNLSVKLGDEYHKFSELQETLGLTDKELLRVLQLTYANTEDAVIKLYKYVEGQGMVEASSIPTLTDTFRGNQEAKLATLNEAVASILPEIGQFTGERVSQLYDDYKGYLENVNSMSFENADEEKGFLVEILANGDEQLKATLKEKSLEDLRTYAGQFYDKISEFLKTPMDKKLDQMARITELGVDLDVAGEMDKWFGKNQQETAERQSNSLKEMLKKRYKKFPEIISFLDKEFADKLIDFDTFDTAIVNLDESVKKIKADKKALKDSGFSQELITKLATLTGKAEEDIRKSIIEGALNKNEFDKMLSKAMYDHQGKRTLSDKQSAEIDKFIKELDLTPYQTKFMSYLIKDLGMSVSTALDTILSKGTPSHKMDEETNKQYAERLAQYLNISNEKVINLLDDIIAPLNEKTTEGVESFLTQLENAINAGHLTLTQATGIVEANSGLINEIDLTKVSGEAMALLQELGFTVDTTTGKLNEIKSQAKVDASSVSTQEVAEASSGLKEGLFNLALDVANFVRNLNPALGLVSSVTNSGSQRRVGSGGMATGGLVPTYRANGGPIFWKPKGTDTVPTMLTPGEFVIRKRAVESVGVDFLRNLNAHGNKALHNTSNRSIIYNVYNNNNARVNQNIDNKSQYLNGMQGLDRLMRYV